jgi:Skp family chaperone for outer membrane proteins
MTTVNRTPAAVARAVILAVAFGAAMSTGALAQQKPPQPGPLQGGATRILVIDQRALLAQSKVGKDILRQRDAYLQQARNQLQAQYQQIQNDGRALQQQMAILSPAAKKQKIAALEGRQRALQQQAQLRENQIQGGILQAQQKVSIALGPILQGIMQERGGQLLIDKNAVLYSTVNVDVTPIAIQRLDQKMPSVKVGLVNPPQQGR